MLLRMRSLYRSTIARFVALLFVTQLLLIAATLFYFERSAQGALQAQQKASTLELRDELIDGYHVGGSTQLAHLIMLHLASTEGEGVLLLLADGSGAPIVGNLDGWPSTLSRSPPEWRIVSLHRRRHSQPDPVGVLVTPLANGQALLVGHVLTGKLQIVQLYRDTMLWVFVTTIPMALLLALVLTRMISRPVRQVAATAEAIGSGELSHRLMLDGSNDAFDELGHGVNAILDRMEGLVSELRVVTDGLAHDLRSPITRLKSALERARIETDDPVALAALDRVMAESDALLAMLTQALQISRAEAGIGRDRFTATNVNRLLTDLGEIYGPVAEDQGVAIAVRAPADLSIALHRELVSQAIGNLIENALKYAAGATRIELKAERQAGKIAISVSDDGPGIAQENHDEARRKFGRLDPARNLTGSGLGLSLVEATARLHGGSMELIDNEPGLVVRMILHLD